MRFRKISSRWARCLRDFHGELRIIGITREANKMDLSVMERVRIEPKHPTLARTACTHTLERTEPAPHTLHTNHALTRAHFALLGITARCGQDGPEHHGASKNQATLLTHIKVALT